MYTNSNCSSKGHNLRTNLLENQFCRVYHAFVEHAIGWDVFPMKIELEFLIFILKCMCTLNIYWTLILL